MEKDRDSLRCYNESFKEYPVAENMAIIYLWEGRFLYVGRRIDTRLHAHHALQIALSLDDPFCVKADNGEWIEVHGMIIAPDRDHECKGSNSRFLYISIDPESLESRMLIESYLKESSLHILERHQTESFIKEFVHIPSRQQSIKQVSYFVDCLVTSLLCDKKLSTKISSNADVRIEKVIRIIRQTTGKNISLKNLAEAAGISSGRLVHLFKEEIGIPIRRFALWVRLNRAFLEITQHKNLTDIAHYAGFSDSAHFSRTFSKTFGIPPSEIFKNSQIIQAFSTVL